jgi:Mg2+ and Co2+ transporter CorA
VPTKQQLIDKHGGYTPELSEQHEALIEKILESEEVMISSHRKHIDDAVELAGQEMELLNEVEQPGSDIQKYALALDKILGQRMREIAQIRERLHQFYKDVKTEEVLTELFEETENPEPVGGDAVPEYGQEFADDLLDQQEDLMDNVQDYY